MKALHVAPHVTNIGDGALIKGIQNTLPTDIDKNIALQITVPGIMPFTI
jgi:hypothetical protein